LKFQKTLIVNLAFALLGATLIFFFSQKGLLDYLKLSALDFSFNLRGPISYNPRIVIIEISDSDIISVGRWPWERKWLSALTRALSELGAKYVYYDIILSEASREEDDSLLEEALKASHNVYLPFAFQNEAHNYKDALIPIKRFSSYIQGTGATNIYPDIDGTIRRVPLIFRDKEKVYPHAALQIAMDYAGLKIREIDPRFLLLSGPKNETVKVPLIKKNTFLINWTGKWQNTFKHYGFLDVLAAYKDFLDHKTPQVPISDFRNSICLVGLTAIGLYDIKPIPLQPEYPGVGVIANTLSDLLDKSFLFDVPDWINVLLLFLLALMPAFLISGEKPFKETLAVFLLAFAFVGVNALLFRRGILLDFSLPLLGLVLNGSVVGIYNFIRVAVERQNFFNMAVTDGLTALFNIRYFKMLLDTEIIMARADRTKIFSIVMTDIDHFKKFNDTYGHQVGDLVLKEVGAALKNSVRTSDIVARYGGEEMILLLRGSILKDALNIAEKLRKSIENTLINDQQNTYRVTVSFGVAEFRGDDTAESLIKRADEGLYKAKQQGRNRVSSVEIK